MTDKEPSAREEFVGEAIIPSPGTMDTAGMARGEPGLPMRFTWRGKEYTVVEVLSRWKKSGPCRNGSPELYVRRHWFEVRTDDGSVMKLFFERQPRSAREKFRRWWLHTIHHHPSFRTPQ